MPMPGHHFPCETGCSNCADVHFWPRVEKTETCWIWRGAANGGRGNGLGKYGLVKIGGRRWLTHRVSYLLVKGPIPDGLELDHLCRNTMCVRPDHLEAVTHQVNIDRVPRPPRKPGRASPSRCAGDHRWQKATTAYTARGIRRCLVCLSEEDPTLRPRTKRQLKVRLWAAQQGMVIPERSAVSKTVIRLWEDAGMPMPTPGTIAPGKTLCTMRP